LTFLDLQSILALAAIMDIPAQHHSLIILIEDGTSLPGSIFHIYAGMTVLMIVRLISRKSPGRSYRSPLLYLPRGANETMDYLNYGMR
jgi:hypothetical protein